MLGITSVSGKTWWFLFSVFTTLISRDQDGSESRYQPVAIISHHGQMTTDGEGQGHYTCDVRTKDGRWYKTNDNEVPITISKRKLSKYGAVVLYSKINSQW